MPVPRVLADAESWLLLPTIPRAAPTDPDPDEPATGGEGLFELLGRLLEDGEELLLRAAPIIGAAALIWLAVEVKFAIGRVILIALAILLMVVFTRNIMAGCDLIAREIIGPEGTCEVVDSAPLPSHWRLPDI